ncbi:ABC transporter ATP-binding protein [Ignavigranum ruoffiae]|uniref:ABC-2 type transport system ATP-binding protein n=1 Tax=Ignavigranum ruoffiae TaxID=89093 RepID=A0A1H9GHB5_9LACT|nr:ABC transporter ATP-binding protein [Ignavigranum ruoffiae]UPQ86597.1 ABC transporter ATP-binding protein [Ignavigranum ruoffiae]SEQ49467.1 ABC-2 type transport system ATP-binding protein [Ignavigranum ruoffiae]
MSQVQINNIFKRYGKQEVLSNVSLMIESGERFGLIGPNGAGKSTLIDILTGLVAADSGDIYVDGLELKKNLVQIRQNIGLVPQEIALLEDVDARSNLEYFGVLYGLSGKVLRTRIDEALEVTGLTDHLKKATKTFSGGMKRRLNIAAAILHHPKLLILDEPTVGVDPQSRNKIFEFVKFMNENYQTTVLYTSHYMEEIEALTERLFILDQGKQVAYGTQDEIKAMVQDTVKWRLELAKAPSDLAENLQAKIAGIEQLQAEFNRFDLVVDPSQFKVSALIDFIHDRHLELIALAKVELSLEEAFLQLTGKRLRDK